MRLKKGVNATELCEVHTCINVEARRRGSVQNFIAPIDKNTSTTSQRKKEKANHREREIRPRRKPIR